MTTKFTPGPWYTGEPFETFPGAGLRFHISQAEGAPYTPHYSDVAQFVAETISSEKLAIQQANARLIAAAPELYQALDNLFTDMIIAQGNMRDAAKRDHRWEGCAEEIQPRIDAARAALAKARGET